MIFYVVPWRLYVVYGLRQMRVSLSYFVFARSVNFENDSHRMLSLRIFCCERQRMYGSEKTKVFCCLEKKKHAQNKVFPQQKQERRRNDKKCYGINKNNKTKRYTSMFVCSYVGISPECILQAIQTHEHTHKQNV